MYARRFTIETNLSLMKKIEKPRFLCLTVHLLVNHQYRDYEIETETGKPAERTDPV